MEELDWAKVFLGTAMSSLLEQLGCCRFLRPMFVHVIKDWRFTTQFFEEFAKT